MGQKVAFNPVPRQHGNKPPLAFVVVVAVDVPGLRRELREGGRRNHVHLVHRRMPLVFVA